jgi:hypothetical protein
MLSYIKFKKTVNGVTIKKGIYADTGSTVFIIKDSDGYSAHGDTLEEARLDLQYKKLSDVDEEELIKTIKKAGFINMSQYRVLTGACTSGTKTWLKKNN